MKIDGLIWLRDIVDKLAWKHQVDTEEVEEVLNNQPITAALLKKASEKMRTFIWP